MPNPLKHAHMVTRLRLPEIAGVAEFQTIPGLSRMSQLCPTGAAKSRRETTS